MGTVSVVRGLVLNASTGYTTFTFASPFRSLDVTFYGGVVEIDWEFHHGHVSNVFPRPLVLIDFIVEYKNDADASWSTLLTKSYSVPDLIRAILASTVADYRYVRSGSIKENFNFSSSLGNGISTNPILRFHTRYYTHNGVTLSPYTADGVPHSQLGLTIEAKASFLRNNLVVL